MRNLDFTHDPGRQSWLASANDARSEFPLQNLPFCVFKPTGTDEPFRGGVGIGSDVLDLRALALSGLLTGAAAEAAVAASGTRLNPLLELGTSASLALRHGLHQLLASDATADQQTALADMLVPQREVVFDIPILIGDYSDFYTSYYHALNIQRQLNPDAADVAANFHYMPIGYHGRASSIGVSGGDIRRPNGQYVIAGSKTPQFGRCRKLDYELELGIVVGSGNELGVPVPVGRAESHIFGVCLLNDWSARDIQSFEMAPLGPFQAKNFSTTLSPWIVTMEALAPFRHAWHRDKAFAQPLPHLNSSSNSESGGLDIQVEVWMQTAARSAAGLAMRLSASSFKHQHWTAAQILSHHTVGGCNLQPGDLLGSGTISGPGKSEAGALIELTEGGVAPIELRGPDGAVEHRSFLEDGDTVILRAYCEREGFRRIGFGECRGTVVPSLDASYWAPSSERA